MASSFHVHLKSKSLPELTSQPLNQNVVTCGPAGLPRGHRGTHYGGREYVHTLTCWGVGCVRVLDKYQLRQQNHLGIQQRV